MSLVQYAACAAKPIFADVHSQHDLLKILSRMLKLGISVDDVVVHRVSDQ